MPPVIRDVISLPDAARPWRWPWVQLGHLRRLQWSKYTVAIPNLSPKLNGLRIVHITDPHVETIWMPAWDRLLENLAADPPDLILITGDFVDRKEDYRPALPFLHRLLDPLHARLGVWGIIGNHDGDAFALAQNEFNVRMLFNEKVSLIDGETTLDIVGLHGVMPEDASPRVLRDIGAKHPKHVRLVMTHFPYQVLCLDEIDPDMIFAGHTHGGQVCLPGGHPIITHDALPRKYARGVHRINGKWLSIPRGVGYSNYRIRTFCPAEVMDITLARGTGHE